MILGARIANRTPGAEIDGELSENLPLSDEVRIARHTSVIHPQSARSANGASDFPDGTGPQQQFAHRPV